MYEAQEQQSIKVSIQKCNNSTTDVLIVYTIFTI